MSPLPQPEFLNNLADEAEPEVKWLWHGFLAPANVTLLTSQWKSGKTTLLSVLLSQLAYGGQVAGLAVNAGRAVILSEEDRMHWRLRSRQLDLGPRALVYCRPFRGNPTRDEWRAMIENLARVRAAEGLDLLVLDTMSPLLPAGATQTSENLFQAIRPLEELTSAGMAVLLMHHPRKGHHLPGQAARGTGALTGYADIVLEMSMGCARHDRRRRIASWSRHTATPRELHIELDADRRNYTVVDRSADDFARFLRIAGKLIQQLDQPVSRTIMTVIWPGKAPSPSAMYKYLERGVAEGKLIRCGTGHREDAFRYLLPGMRVPKDCEPEFRRPASNSITTISTTSLLQSVVPEPAAIAEPVRTDSNSVMAEPVAEPVESVSVAAQAGSPLTDALTDDCDTVLDVSDSTSMTPVPPPSEPGEADPCLSQGIDGGQDPEPGTR